MTRFGRCGGGLGGGVQGVREMVGSFIVMGCKVCKVSKEIDWREVGQNWMAMFGHG